MRCAPPCENGDIETEQCTSVSDRVCDRCQRGETLLDDGTCETCLIGTFDHDRDPQTACIACTVCPANTLSSGVCSPTSDVRCVACGENPSTYVGDLYGVDGPHSLGCDERDPNCASTIDIIAYYTPAFLELVGDDLGAVEDRAFYSVHIANQALRNSMLPPQMRYRLIDIQSFPYQERDSLKSDLVYLRSLPHYQATRKSLAADVGLFFLGTQGYGGYAYSNMGTGATYADSGIAVLDGYYQTDDFARCGTAFETPAHELGHLMGAQHMATQFQNPRTTDYAYHNQEPLFRRNEAYGRAVSQHGLKFYTLMAYSAYKNENNVRRACPDCVQFPVYSSPDLWWFFRPADPLYGTCLVQGEPVNDMLEIACQVDMPWVFVDGEYIIDQNAVRPIHVDELLDRAVPLGVDEPTYIDPSTGDVVTASFSTRNRDKVIAFWPFKSGNAAPLRREGACDADCAALNRARCTVSNPTCGFCLPGYLDVGGTCLGRVDQVGVTALTDGVYAQSGEVATTEGEQHEIVVPITPGSTIGAIELYLFTVDEMGALKYSWVSMTTIWTANSAPPHTFSIAYRTEDDDVEPVGSIDTDGVFLQHTSGQTNHTLSYRLPVHDPMPASEVIIQLQSLDAQYGFEVAEVRVFGQAP
ncbi:MAG: M12 family metallo-peptidase [Myxococcota bacterium]|nr:M12 family metallo-peptidase [Myxococcota bacterium]